MGAPDVAEVGGCGGGTAALSARSVAAAGCRSVDHPTASDEFGRFCALEKNAGRPVAAQWDWIAPPLAGAK